MRHSSRHKTFNLAPWQRIVVPRRRAARAVKGPGRVKVRHIETAQLVDLRPSMVYLSTPELMTADNVRVRIAATATVRVVDPVLMVRNSQTEQSFIIDAAQAALANAVFGRTFDQVNEARAALTAEIYAELAALGERGVAVETFEIRDIDLPSDLGRSTTRRTAPSETVAVRGLANAARRSTEGPAAFQLRLLQRLDKPTGQL